MKKPLKMLRKMCGFAALGLVLLGLLGFLSTAFSGCGYLAPGSGFAWPVVYARDYITLEDGSRVVPLPGPARIQLYDADWRFLRGWQLDAGGGTFRLRAGEGGSIDVYTARNNRHYHFDMQGTLLLEERFERFNEIAPSGQSAWVRCPWWKLPFANPPLGPWATAAAGMLALVFLLPPAKLPPKLEQYVQRRKRP